ncbi:MAG: hypothetical protein QOE77_507 [Blastocatellia bacterium]|jgi:hypothetical protein|nr:hypothetical protein [Blastocatellia bacterium]
MKTSMRKSLIIIALALLVGLVCLLWLASRSNETNDMPADNLSNTSQGPAFEVRVIVPRSGLPLGGILPDWVLKKYDLTPRELQFDQTGRGARIVSVGNNRLEISADVWNLLIEIDDQGRIAPATHFVFPIKLGGRNLRLSCQPADPATGYLGTTKHAGSDELGGRFLVELATCKNADSGKTTNWPPAPLTLRGSFAGLTQPRP